MYCGKWNMKEEEKLDNSLIILNGSINKIVSKFLPANKGERNVVFIQPNNKCQDIYPRKVGKPSKYPLGN